MWQRKNVAASGSTLAKVAGGRLGVVTTLIAWWFSAAGVLKSPGGQTVLPLVERKTA